MKKNKLSSLADKPYLVWSILFIIAPLLMVAYYALTDKSGAFSLASVEQFRHISLQFCFLFYTVLRQLLYVWF